MGEDISAVEAPMCGALLLQLQQTNTDPTFLKDRARQRSAWGPQRNYKHPLRLLTTEGFPAVVQATKLSSSSSQLEGREWLRGDRGRFCQLRTRLEHHRWCPACSPRQASSQTAMASSGACGLLWELSLLQASAWPARRRAGQNRQGPLSLGAVLSQ